MNWILAAISNKCPLQVTLGANGSRRAVIFDTHPHNYQVAVLRFSISVTIKRISTVLLRNGKPRRDKLCTPAQLTNQIYFVQGLHIVGDEAFELLSAPATITERTQGGSKETPNQLRTLSFVGLWDNEAKWLENCGDKEDAAVIYCPIC